MDERTMRKNLMEEEKSYTDTVKVVMKGRRRQWMRGKMVLGKKRERLTD